MSQALDAKGIYHSSLAAGVLAIGGIGIIINPFVTAAVFGVCAIGGVVGKRIYHAYHPKDLYEEPVPDTEITENPNIEQGHSRPGLLEGEGFILGK